MAATRNIIQSHPTHHPAHAGTGKAPDRGIRRLPTHRVGSTMSAGLVVGGIGLPVCVRTTQARWPKVIP